MKSCLVPFTAVLAVCSSVCVPVLGKIPDATHTNAPASESSKIRIVYRAQTGQVRLSRARSIFAYESGGVRHTIEQKSTGKTVYGTTSADGNVIYTDTPQTQDILMDGQKAAVSETFPTATATFRANGLLCGYTSTQTDKAATQIEARLNAATNPVFPDRSVGVGDKWTVEYPENTALGLRAAHADFETTGRAAGTPLATEVRVTYTETGSQPVVVRGRFLVEEATGDKLAGEYTVENWPLAVAGGVLATVTVQEERTDGGPLPGLKTPSLTGFFKAAPIKTVDQAVQGFTKLPGAITLYRKTEAGRDTLLAELREDQIGKLMLLQATAGTGTSDQIIAGDPISDIVFKWTRTPDDKLLMVVPNWRFVADPQTPMGRAVRRSFADGFLQSFKIEAVQPERDSVLIDVSDLFRTDTVGIAATLAGGFMGIPNLAAGYVQDREKTFVESVQNFPENLTVATRFHFARAGRYLPGTALADTRSVPLTVAFNLFALPNDAQTYQPTNGYAPRRADGRIGYFTTEQTNFADDSRDDQTDRFILRWDIRKSDPNAPVSPAANPVVFWLDNAIPEEYRPVVRRGILLWNKAFEQVGITNAIQVEQMPENADFSHADMRHNVVRWVVTQDGAGRNGVAVALVRHNPLTGQILNASISVDSAWTRFGKLQRRQMIEPAQAFRTGANMDVEALLSPELPGTPSEETARARWEARRALAGDPRYCRIADGLTDSAFVGLSAWSAVAAGALKNSAVTREREKEYTNELLTEVVAHEMGHILGLQHNFVASTEWTLKQLADPDLVAQKGIGASLMDYNAFNVSALDALQGSKRPSFYSQTVGDYDLWAIEYGYKPFAPGSEDDSLRRIALRANEPGHAFQSDAEASAGIDPGITPYDMSSEPLAYWEKMLQLSRGLLTNLDARLPLPGDSYYEFTKAFNLYLNTYARAAGYASRSIGGLRVRRAYKGEGAGNSSVPASSATVPLASSEQRKALTLLNTYVFGPQAFHLPARYYTQLMGDPFGSSSALDFPVADQIAGVQKIALQRVLSATVLRRVFNNEFKTADGPATLTMAALFDSLGKSIWAEVDAHQNVPTLRRQLQRAYLDLLSEIILRPTGHPEDARMLAWDQLKQLRTRLTQAQHVPDPHYDAYTRIHLADSRDKCDRLLNAGLLLNAPQTSGGMGNLLQALFGGKPVPTADE